LAHSVSARKRIRQTTKRHATNASARSMYRTYVKKVLSAVESGDKAAAEAAYKAAVPVIDRAAGRGLVPGNRAARNKSRLNNSIRKMA
jgi:small subunit ribosomal protein S20